MVFLTKEGQGTNRQFQNNKQERMMTTEREISIERRGPVALIALGPDRQPAILGYALVKALCEAMEALDQDPEIRVIILTGGERVFAAGANLAEMANKGPFDGRLRERFVLRDRINRVAKPIIAAVAGAALGGGSELAMCCDIILAADNARFGQPEILFGIIPGSGGTQRLARLVGKHKAMEMVLTGDPVNAEEARQLGIVNRVVPQAELLDAAWTMAASIAAKPALAVKAAKESILAAFNTGLNEGLAIERGHFWMLLASEDANEGMNAFVEKRKPVFKGK
jgi:enoyl-CoA hydratase